MQFSEENSFPPKFLSFLPPGTCTNFTWLSNSTRRLHFLPLNCQNSKFSYQALTLSSVKPSNSKFSYQALALSSVKPSNLKFSHQALTYFPLNVQLKIKFQYQARTHFPLNRSNFEFNHQVLTLSAVNFR